MKNSKAQRGWIITTLISVGLLVYSAVFARGGSKVNLPLVMSGEPTYTPLPTATATPPGQTVEIDSSNAFTSEITPTLWMVHSAFEGTGSDLYSSLEVMVWWVNEDAVIKQEVATPYLLTPLCFAVAFDVSTLPSTWTDYHIFITEAGEPQERYISLGVEDSTIGGTEYGTRVTRLVRNNHDYPVYRASTYGMVTDANRDIIECASNDNPTDLGPGQSAYTVTEWFHSPPGGQYINMRSAGFIPIE